MACKGKSIPTASKLATTTLSASYMREHSGWKVGRLRKAGGVEDQPAKWVQAMRLCDSTIAEQQIKARKEAERKRGRHGG